MKHLKIFESLNEDIIDVFDPNNRYPVARKKVYSSLKSAEEKLKTIEQQYEKNKTMKPYDWCKSNKEVNRVVNIINNTAAHEVCKLREKYKTDEPLSDFERNSIGMKYNWDEEKLIDDPINEEAQKLMHQAARFLREDWTPSRVDSKKVHNTFLSLKKEVQDIDDPKLKTYHPPAHLDFDNMSWDEVKRITPEQIKSMTKAQIQAVVDKSLDMKDFSVTKKFSSFLKESLKHIESFSNFRRI